MTIIDEQQLVIVRRRDCEWCGHKGPSEPAHISARGHGAGRRLDVGWNLVALCAPFANACHHRSHNNGRPNFEDLKALAAKRAGVSINDWEEALFAVQRLPNRSPQRLIEAELAGLPDGARRLVQQVLDARRAA